MTVFCDVLHAVDAAAGVAVTDAADDVVVVAVVVVVVAAVSAVDAEPEYD